MIRVASLDDPRVSGYRHIADVAWLQHANLFVAEGRLVVRRVLLGGRFAVRSILVTEPALESLRDVLDRVQGEVLVIEQRAMNEVVGFNIHRGCLALAERPAAQTIADLPLGSLRRVVVLEGVNNPDNIGGIFRSAAAFGVDAIVLGPSCSDPLYRKSVRTSMAATLAVPFAEAGAWPDALARLRAHGITVIAITPAGDARPLDVLPRGLDRVALLVGAEGEGLSAEAMRAADARVRIPMRGPADSLNVTVAASVALHWFSAADAS